MINVAEYRGRGIYEFASLVERCAESYRTFLEILGDDASPYELLFSPHKTSILHCYINTTIWVEYSRSFRKNSELYDLSDTEYWTELAGGYGVAMKSFDEFNADKELREQYAADYGADPDDLFYVWFLSQEVAFEELWGRMTEEVFRLLFGNRRFLLTFNESLATYLEENPQILVGSRVTSKGRIARCSNVPRWLRNAIYHRDHGRCTLCMTDLTGLLSAVNSYHLDHIVPLKLFGTNDPVNFQLLCADCNQRKAGGPGNTSYLYPPWWSEIDDA